MRLKFGHPLDNRGERSGKIKCHGQTVVRPIVIPVHFGQRECLAAEIVDAAQTSVANKKQRLRRAFAFLVIVLALGHGRKVTLRPKQSLMRTELERRSALARIAMWALRPRDEHAAPTATLLDMNQFDGIPPLIDGFIVSVVALAAVRLNPSCQPFLLPSHQSAEQGHRLVLRALNVHPLVSLDLRLGEGSGAAVALPLVRLACALHNGMATFAQANVPDRPAG